MEAERLVFLTLDVAEVGARNVPHKNTQGSYGAMHMDLTVPVSAKEL
jgi:hypothetical protein